MKQIAVLGSGNIGSMIVDLLSLCGDYEITIADRSHEHLDLITACANVKRVQLDIRDGAALDRVLAGQLAVLNATPYSLTTCIAQAARIHGVHYLDLTEDLASTRFVKRLANNARSAFIPQCGLAPGFVTIVASDVAKRFDTLQDVRLRVGALPRYRSMANCKFAAIDG